MEPAPGWSVVVEKLAPRSYRTMFYVGVQGFRLAQADDAEDEDAEAEEHCIGMKQMFLRALDKLGVEPGSPLKPDVWDRLDALAVRVLAMTPFEEGREIVCLFCAAGVKDAPSMVVPHPERPRQGICSTCLTACDAIRSKAMKANVAPDPYCLPWVVALRQAPGAATCADPDCYLSGSYSHVGPCEPCACAMLHAIEECPQRPAPEGFRRVNNYLVCLPCAQADHDHCPAGPCRCDCRPEPEKK
jgi:hypothetical protein